MSKQPMGKTLLRNVIRHTDAHNKIQEEMEMWKMRDWEIQTSHHKHIPTDGMRGHMHCDRVSDQLGVRSRSRERVTEHDDREARYWTRKLYEFEAGDPDRWGHSGFKELYPEEFESDGEKRGTLKNTGRRKMKKSRSDAEACLSKHSKKSSKKKKKKKKKAEDGKRKKDESSTSECSSDDSSAMKDKQRKRKRTKSRQKTKKTVKRKGRDEDSSTGGSNEQDNREKKTRSRKKRKQDSDSGSLSKKRRKTWKAAGEESLDDSSAD